MTTQQVDPLRVCKEARDELRAAATKLQRIGNFFGDVARALVEDEICLRLANSGLFAPSDLPHDRSVDYEAWPSREDVKELLADYYETLTRFRASYHALAPDERMLFDGAGSASGQRSPQRTPLIRRV